MKQTNHSDLSDGSDLGEIKFATEAGIAKPAHLPDLADLALPQNFPGLTETFTENVLVPVSKPNKQLWISPYADREKWMPVAIIEDATDKTSYILTGEMARQLETGEWSPKILVPYITRQGTVSLWPIRLPDSEGKLDTWNRSALSIATANGNQWIRVTSSKEAKGYQTTKPVAAFPPPEWPDDLVSIYQKALAPLIIRNMDHPLIKRLRGEV